MIIAIWTITLLLVGLWTLAAWGISSLFATDGVWIAQVEPWLARLPFGGWLESWFPDWLRVAQALLEGVQALIAWLGGAAPVLVWGLWGAGAFLLVLLALALSLLVALIRRTTPPPKPPEQSSPQQPPAAAA